MKQLLFFVFVCSFYFEVQSQQLLMSESFEGTFPPAGWTITNEGTGNNWAKGSSLPWNGDANMQYTFKADAAANAWAITPAIGLNTNPCYISFIVVKDYGYTQRLKFTVGNANTIAAQTTVLKDDNNYTSNSHRKWTITYTPTTAGYYYFGLNCYSVANNYYGIMIDSITVRQAGIPCTSSPNGGTTTTAVTSVCPNTAFALNVSDATNVVTGLTYQWQSSSNNSIWNDIDNQIQESYTNNTGIANPTYFRRRIKCGVLEAFSSPILMSLRANPTPVYAQLPFIENFEASWQNQCGGSNSLPSASWLNEPLTGSDSWRRFDQGASAGWYRPDYAYYYGGANGTASSARFHSYGTSVGATGSLSVYIDCSSGYNTKELSFYKVGGDSLFVELSTNGGTTFLPLNTVYSPVYNWSKHLIGFTSTSAQTVIRFRAKKSSFQDVQIDEVLLASVPCYSPAALYVTPFLTTAKLSLVASEYGISSGFEYAVTTSATPPQTGMLTTDTTVTVSGLAESTTYYAHLRQVCTGTGSGNWISQSFLTSSANCIPQYSWVCAGPFGLIKRFALKGEAGSLINTENLTCTKSYINYSASTNATLMRGKSYSCLVGSDTINTFSIWIDFNDDHAFTLDEKVVTRFETSLTRENNVLSFYVPLWANTGAHRLRLRLNIDDPCETGNYGQAHDYTITIVDAAGGSAYSVSPGVGNTCVKGGGITINSASNNNNEWVPLVDSSNNIIASVNANGNNLGQVAVYEYINAGPLRLSPGGKPYLDRNPQISVSSQPTTKVGVRLYLLESEYNKLKAADSAITSLNDLWLTKTSQACGAVIGEGQVYQPVNSGATGNGYFVEYSISGFSSFYFQSPVMVLPVTMSRLSLTRQGGEDKLTWQTTTEQGNAGFEVESSKNGDEFNKIGFVITKAVNGNANSVISYSYKKVSTAAKTYYRIKQLDKDGKYIYSNVVVAEVHNLPFFKLNSVYPNPGKNHINLEILSAMPSIISVIVTDVSGQSVLKKNHPINSGTNQIEIDISTLSTGSYSLKISTSSGLSTHRKFVKL